MPLPTPAQLAHMKRMIEDGSRPIRKKKPQHPAATPVDSDVESSSSSDGELYCPFDEDTSSVASSTSSGTPTSRAQEKDQARASTDVPK